MPAAALPADRDAPRTSALLVTASVIGKEKLV